MADYPGAMFPKHVKRVSAKEFLKELAKSEKGNKYGIKKVYDGAMRFDSGLEREFYKNYLRPMEMSGELKDLVREPKVELDVDGEIFVYKPDFGAFNTNLKEPVFYETKGEATRRGERWRMIKKLWRVRGPGRLYVYLGSKESYRLLEVILPRGQGE
jgi:hypothetical protein